MASVIASSPSNQKTAQIFDCRKCSKAFFRRLNNERACVKQPNILLKKRSSWVRGFRL
ncbi:hypothetical protein HMPREF1408_01589 [Helicobacter pylori GAM245Ai]|nr:hypothetical protein HMPREF1408_01589 [Helicobacter pylori GAM245Ai]